MTQLRLTLRRRQVAELLSEGQSNKRIAKELGLSSETVKEHVRATLALLGCTRTQLKGRTLIDSPFTPAEWRAQPVTQSLAPITLPPLELPIYPPLPPLPLPADQTFDVEHAFQVIEGYAYILGRTPLMFLPGAIWPGLARLPEWLLELARPARITLSEGAKLSVYEGGVDDAYCAALGAQALVRAPARQALAAAPLALGQSPSPLDLCRLAACSQETLRRQGVIPERTSNLPPFAREHL